jgi:hypothetical protein
MTIRKGKAGDPKASQAAGEAAAHVRRPDPRRDEPKRATQEANPAPTGAAGVESATPPPGHDQNVSESVAHVVKLGYDVIAENIRQGRLAAAKFRQGEYRVGEVPGDLEVATRRLLHLARELSSTTFDVCERLLKEVGSVRPPQDQAKGVPAFRPAQTPTAKPAAQATPPPAAKAPDRLMKVTVRFVGGPVAVARSETLARPRRPAQIGDISAGPLAPRTPGGAPIADVSFETDVSVEGIVAVVTLAKRQAPGIYSGVVFAKDDDVPLGVLTVEIPK